MGTELLARDIPLPLPLWSAECNLTHPDDVLEIHRAYAKAGADVLTTNTFRTTPRAYFSAGNSLMQAREKARESLFRAVDLARKAVSTQEVWGSITALEDCYQPELSPGKEAAMEEYEEQVSWFEESAIDALLFETMGHTGEIEAAVSQETSLPKYLSMILADSEHLLDGTNLIKWLPDLPKQNLSGILINCTNTQTALSGMETIQKMRFELFGAYPNLGTTQPTTDGHLDKHISETEWESFIDRALEKKVSFIGACCGSTPDHIRTIREKVDRLSN